MYLLYMFEIKVELAYNQRDMAVLGVSGGISAVCSLFHIVHALTLIIPKENLMKAVTPRF